MSVITEEHRNMADEIEIWLHRMLSGWFAMHDREFSLQRNCSDLPRSANGIWVPDADNEDEAPEGVPSGNGPTLYVRMRGGEPDDHSDHLMSFLKWLTRSIRDGGCWIEVSEFDEDDDNAWISIAIDPVFFKIVQLKFPDEHLGVQQCLL